MHEKKKKSGNFYCTLPLKMIEWKKWALPETF